ncbi:MAG: ATP-binding protein [Limisphaerales bacterium]
MKNKFFNNPEALRAYVDYERQIYAKHLEIGCCLVMALMPAGVVLDFFVYPQEVGYFLKLRLAAAFWGFVIWLILQTSLREKIHRSLSLIIVLVPSFFICWMIYATQGVVSPYYAGLNLVLLAIALVMRWSVDLSITASLLVIAMYLGACLLCGPILPSQFSVFVNNLYFLSLTAVIVIVGGHLHNRLRIREFILNYELNKNKQELERTNRKLIELDKLKSRFFANVSHEMRTPLTLLVGPLETLMRRFDRARDPKSFELLETMHANGLRLLNLVNDLLDLIRLEAGRMQVKAEPLDVAGFLKGLASAVRLMAAEKKIELETHADAELGLVLTDRDKIEKIVLNLLFNALKFTLNGGRIWLRAEKQSESRGSRCEEIHSKKPETSQSLLTPTLATLEKMQNEEFVIIVGDTGIGIAEKNLPFIFDRFWQADNSSKRKFQGVGIGLALVKELTEMMSGSVTVKSEEGKGSTFAVRLPFQKAEVSSVKPETVIPPMVENGDVDSNEWLTNLYRRAEFFPALESLRSQTHQAGLAGRKPVALIADDEPDMRRFLRAELDEDYELIEAVDGLDALHKSGEFLPDIILLDMMMPQMDGLEVSRELRKREATAKIPIVLLTARADEETKFDALQMGANDFLAKPFSSVELHARIRNLIDSHHYQRKLSKQNVALTSAIEQIKDTETQLVQSEKLASLGRLSAGIIHEINNPLNFTLTGLFVLRNKSKMLAPERRAEYDEVLNDMEEGLKRVRNIVSDLRTFTHPGGGAGELVDVADAVAASLRFLAGEWKDKAEIKQNLPPNQFLWANRNKLIHVLVNLLQNSIDALAEKKFEASDAPTIWIEGRVEGDRSLIVVRDNGPGIDQKLTDKIFDPFFTTKEVGKGMGLGLSICYRIVHGYGGQISVKSERGKFCEFTLDFPTKDESLAELNFDDEHSLRL